MSEFRFVLGVAWWWRWICGTRTHPSLRFILYPIDFLLFQVITSVTFKTYPAITSILSIYMSIQTTSAAYYDLLKTYIALQPALDDANVTGYALSQSLGTFFFHFIPNFDGDIEKANATHAPLYKLAEESGGAVTLFSDVRVLPSYLSVFAGDGFQEGGTPTIMGSRLFPRGAFESEDKVEALARFLAVYPGGKFFMLGE